MLAVAAWVSLAPYFVWGSTDGLLFGAIAASLVVAAMWILGAHLPRGSELWGVVLVSIFIVYITIEPKLDGGHTRWIFTLPTLWAIALFSSDQRRQCLSAFATLFAVSVIPAIVISLWLAAGMPFTFKEIPHPNALMASQGVHILASPGALFIESNSVSLPWDGVLFRLTAIYDEPGTVGTVAALLWGALGFRFSDWRAPILYTAGVLSFSLAFAALAIVGCLMADIIRRRPLLMMAVLPTLIALLMALGLVNVPRATETRVFVERAGPVHSSELPETRAIVPGDSLRQSTIDNRTLPPMRILIDEYLHSGPKTLLLGIASDASAVRGGLSQVWTRIPVDHGILGSALLLAGMALIGFNGWRRSRYALLSLLFLALFFMSVYQRPVVWLPYSLTLFMCGVLSASSAEAKSKVHVGNSVPVTSVAMEDGGSSTRSEFPG